MNRTVSLIEHNCFFDCAEPFPRFNRSFSSEQVKSRAFNEMIASPRYRNAEPSPFRWRALGDWLDPKDRFSQSSNTLLTIPKSALRKSIFRQLSYSEQVFSLVFEAREKGKSVTYCCAASCLQAKGAFFLL